MKLCAASIAGLCTTLALSLVSTLAFSQTNTTPVQPEPHGQVIYSRSTDENGQSTTTTGPAAQTAQQSVSEPIATDEERASLTITSLDLDVHLRPAEQFISVRAQLIVRNDGKAPLMHIPLQLSSSLAWDRIRIADRDAAFKLATLNSDSDHTGQLHEAAITPAAPLAPNASAQLDVSYSGKIQESAQRLLAIGAPDELALHSDWDRISTNFTGLRGFGNVVWYPAASIPVILGDGARLFDEMGEHKLRFSGAQFRMHLTVEFPAGQEPTVAVINGHPVSLTTTSGSEEINGIATAEVSSTRLGFEAPSLFVAIRKAEQAANATFWSRTENESSLFSWSQAASTVTPFLQNWLGQTPRSQLTVLDLPDQQDTPFETGSLLATGIHPAADETLQAVLVHGLTHAWLQSPHAWINEGVAHFMGTLWLEKTSGRAQALESLEAQRTALALAEPASPGTGPGQPLAKAISPIYYRTKATYIFWMLRDLTGDAALSGALRAYEPAADAATPGSLERLLQQAAPNRDLSWFFADWVDADKGLPDLTIANVVPLPAQAGNTLVGITIKNAGYSAAEVPVTVSTHDTSVSQRVIVPARGSVTPRILIFGTPTRVQVNDGTVPEVQASEHITTLGGASEGSSSSSEPAVPQPR
jgi:hypothetical protein